VKVAAEGDSAITESVEEDAEYERVSP